MISTLLVFCETKFHVTEGAYNMTHPFYLTMSTIVPSQHIATHLSSILLIVHKLVHFPAKSGCCLTLSLPAADLSAASTSTHCAIG
jgi:hypothetical protein